MEILKQMVHTNITPLYEIIDDSKNDKIFMISQFLISGSMEDRLKASTEEASSLTQAA